MNGATRAEPTSRGGSRAKRKPNGRVSRVVFASVLLIGIALLGYGFFTNSRLWFWAGLFVTLGGVINRVLRLVIRR